MRPEDELDFILDSPEKRARAVKFWLFAEVLAGMLMTVGFLYFILRVTGTI